MSICLAFSNPPNTAPACSYRAEIILSCWVSANLLSQNRVILSETEQIHRAAPTPHLPGSDLLHVEALAPDVCCGYEEMREMLTPVQKAFLITAAPVNKCWI